MQARRHRAPDRRGFTLIELLLTVGLLLLLIGAVVFSFSTLQRGAVLEEGATQFEALLRFARAEAAGTGRQIEIRFDEDFAGDPTAGAGRLHVLWEPDPVAQPGVFADLPEAADFVQAITDLVSIEEMRPWPPVEPANTADRKSDNGRADDVVDSENTFAPLRFYPDGSADSVEIILAARDPDDSRRLAVRYLGLTGNISRRFLPPEGSGAIEGDPDETRRQDAATGGPAAAEPDTTILK